MSKKKQSTENNLSAAKYIKTKARNLPIYECLVSDNWEKSRQPIVVVSRKHSTGNITMCFYVVDLLCTGVTFTYYAFNKSFDEYKELIDVIFGEEQNFVPEAIEYNLAHNIIFAGFEYAKEYGIQPHKDFNITKFMLKEDNEDVELIEIGCGMYGKPYFIKENFTDYNSGSPDHIIRSLERHAGHGNYDVTEKFDSDNIDDEFPYEYDKENFESDISEYLKITQNLDNLKNDEIVLFPDIVYDISNYLADHDLVDKYGSKYFDVHCDNITYEELNPEAFGIEEMDEKTKDKVEKYYNEFFDNIEKCPKIVQRMSQKINKIAEDTPLCEFVNLTLAVLEDNDTASIDEQVSKAIQKHPNHPLIKLFYITHKLDDNKKVIKISDEDKKMSSYFQNRDSLHFTELNTYFIMIMKITVFEQDIELVEALNDYIYNLNLPDEIKHSIAKVILLARINYINNYLGIYK